MLVTSAGTRPGSAIRFTVRFSVSSTRMNGSLGP